MELVGYEDKKAGSHMSFSSVVVHYIQYFKEGKEVHYVNKNGEYIEVK